MNQPRLGVCYYPEHWPEDEWPEHARLMQAMGLRLVRIGEFAWSRIEPRRGRFDWRWLDEVCAVLADAGLEIILGTPTACPPKWLMDECPEIYPLDADLRRRGFGSRRHYCPSNERYRQEAQRIASALTARYATHPAVVGWQIDNEYGCHDTTLSHSPSALESFRQWLRSRYTTIDALNDAWGTVFWSQEYASFDAVETPASAVTETNPSHRLDFQRFSSDQVASFNALQVSCLRRRGGEQWATHNFTGHSLDFDHNAVAADLDIVAWDSYPLGFLDQAWFSEREKERYRRTGHPDWAAFHHDLYRGDGKRRVAVMEQQPGPVNWAEFNAEPLAGMVRLWSWEALAHGAAFVNYFRWQQAPFAQEQMHAGLRRVDGAETRAAGEVRRLVRELDGLALPARGPASVALIFDYESIWMSRIQPQSRSYDPLELIYRWYSGLRSLGVDVDILPPTAPLRDYALIVAPNGLRSDPEACDELLGAPGHLLLGPRSGSKTRDFQIPSNLPPGCLQRRIPLQVSTVDGIRDGCRVELRMAGRTYAVTRWLETVDTELTPRAETDTGIGVWYEHRDTGYVNAWVCDDMLREIFSTVCAGAGVRTVELPAHLRLSRLGDLTFVFNYGPEQARFAMDGAEPVLGSESVAPADLAVWKAADGR